MRDIPRPTPPGRQVQGEDVPSIVDLAAVVVDCQDAPALAAFYRAACGGEVVRADAGGVWMRVGGTLVIFREVAGYRAPTWPSSDVPMQAHLDFFADDLEKAEALLHRHGATTPNISRTGETG